MSDKHSITQTAPLYRFLTEYVHYWTSFIPVLIAGSLVTLATAFIPLVTGQLFTHALPGGNQHLLQYLPLVLAGLLSTAALASLAGDYTICRIYGRLAHDIRMRMFEKLLKLPHAYPDFPAATIASYFFPYIEKLFHHATRLAVGLTRDFLIVIGLLMVMIYLNQEISLLLFTILIITLLVERLLYISAHQQDTPLRIQAEVSETIYAAMQHYRSIYLDQGNEQENRHIRNIFEQLRHTSLKQASNTKLAGVLALIFLTGILTGLLYYLIQQLILSKLTIGDAVAFFTAVVMLFFPLKRLLSIRSSLTQCSEILHTIFSLLDRHIQSTEPVKENLYVSRIEHADGKLHFKHITYLSQNELESLQLPFDLEIKPGMKVALINPHTQTTRLLADFICGFVHPTTGRVLLDDQNINQISRTDLYANIAWITPDRNLLADTIAANIAYGAMHCSVETAITSAAHASQAMEFIRDLPHGLQTRTDDRNVTLSDSQRQQILIARALLKNPAIVILDETVAYFDTDSAPLLHALHTLIRNRTTLILSVRPIMLNFAEYVFDPGQIAQTGCMNTNQYETDTQLTSPKNLPLTER